MLLGFVIGAGAVFLSWGVDLALSMVREARLRRMVLRIACERDMLKGALEAIVDDPLVGDAATAKASEALNQDSLDVYMGWLHRMGR